MPAIDLQNADDVCDALRRGAAACHAAACRHGSIEVIAAPARLIATGDLHDNPFHLATLLRITGLDAGEETEPDAPRPEPLHLTLHEIIHGDRLMNGLDFSYRVLAKVAALKALHPEHVHVMLGNHELSQISGAGIVKDGVRSVDAFNGGLEYVFGGDADRVVAAIGEFVRAMPIALKCICAGGRVILCAHSLPSPAIMQRFDTTILTRDLRDEDYEPRRGAAYIMVWGRGYDAELLEDLVERWGVNMFILGHERADNGAMLVPPNAVVLNSDHARGVYLPIDLDDPPSPEEAVARTVPLATSH